MRGNLEIMLYKSIKLSAFSIKLEPYKLTAGFDGVDGTLQNFLRGKAVGTGTIDLFRRRVVRNLLDERGKTVLEGIDEVTMTAEDRIRINLFDEIAGRI